MEIKKGFFLGMSVLALAGYLIPIYLGFMWVGLGLLLFFATVYMALLVGNSRQYFESKTNYRVITLLAACLMFFHAVRFVHDYQRRDYQKELLLEIRHTIDEGITKNDVQNALFEVLRSYKNEEFETIVASSKHYLGDRLGKDGVFISEFDLNQNNSEKNDFTDFFYNIDEEADEINITVVANIPHGQDLKFENYNGEMGRFEMEFTLTKEGVHYEVVN